MRSFLEAMDAATGKQVWRWYTTPAPGDPGGNTWPSGSKEYLRGGATIWQAPAVDEKLGLLYFSTGNAGSDWFGGDRPGKNLYAASIVALDLKTGKLKWYFQQVHHDIWDLDSASPVVLFDAGGKQGIAQASKTGWLYMLDRATGKPLYGITEKPVPQNAAQKTWPTQPIPDERRVHPARRRAGQGRRARQEAGRRPAREGARRRPEGAVHAAAARQAPDLRQRPAGRRQLAADLLQPEDRR